MTEADLPNCFEPYLRYAIATGFRNFKFDDWDFRLSLLVEFSKAGSKEAFTAAIAESEPEARLDIEFGPGIGHTRYATLRSRKAVVAPHTFPFWNAFVSRVELSLPVRPSTGIGMLRAAAGERWEEEGDRPASLLIGILDDGARSPPRNFSNGPRPGGARGCAPSGIRIRASCR